MMIPIVHTLWLNEEIQTDGHSPMYFLCDDGNHYYCKYRTQLNKDEINCLVYEIVCHALLKKLNIPTPDIAFAIIGKDGFDVKKLKANKRYAKPGTICFASKEASNSVLVTGIQGISKKAQARKFNNIYDLLKIAMFDLWVDNDDRGKGIRENYNLLVQSIQFQVDTKTDTKLQWLAFDHAFAFGGVNCLSIFNETMMPSTYGKLIESNYFKSFKTFFIPAIYENIIENLLPLHNDELNSTIQDIFSQIPAEWQISQNLANRILSFLSNPERISSLKQLSLHSLKK